MQCTHAACHLLASKLTHPHTLSPTHPPPHTHTKTLAHLQLILNSSHPHQLQVLLNLIRQRIDPGISIVQIRTRSLIPHIPVVVLLLLQHTGAQEQCSQALCGKEVEVAVGMVQEGRIDRGFEAGEDFGISPLAVEPDGACVG